MFYKTSVSTEVSTGQKEARVHGKCSRGAPNPWEEPRLGGQIQVGSHLDCDLSASGTLDNGILVSLFPLL